MPPGDAGFHRGRGRRAETGVAMEDPFLATGGDALEPLPPKKPPRQRASFSQLTAPFAAVADDEGLPPPVPPRDEEARGLAARVRRLREAGLLRERGDSFGAQEDAYAEAPRPEAPASPSVSGSEPRLSNGFVDGNDAFAGEGEVEAEVEAEVGALGDGSDPDAAPAEASEEVAAAPAREPGRSFGEADCPTEEIDGLAGAVPIVLLCLREDLEAAGGLSEEGIFRVAPSQTELQAVKEAIQEQRYLPDRCRSDPHVAATLIKVFFRDLPVKMFSCLSPEDMDGAISSPDACLRLVETGFPEPRRSWMLWLLDLLAVTAVREDTNRMGVRNLAIVFAPNLFDDSLILAATQDAQTLGLVMTTKAVKFLTGCLTAILRNYFDYDPAPGADRMGQGC